MKFGKEFKKRKVPEWTDAYMDYNGLKQILEEILDYKQRHQPQAPMSAFQHSLTLHRTFGGLNLKSGNFVSKGDIEDQVIDVSTLPRDGSEQFYKTNFLRKSEVGGELEVMFFEKLDEELNKVNSFYKDKVEVVMHEAANLNKQMDALIAFRIKVVTENPSLNDGMSTSLRSGTSRSSAAKTETSVSMYSTFDADMSDRYQGEESTGDPEVGPLPTTSCSRDFKEDENINKLEDDSLEILERVKISNSLESPLSTIKGFFKDFKGDELRFGKQNLKNVEEQLRVVFIEFYQKLLLLKHYSFINLTAFFKIMKKYEKITSRRASKSYLKIVDDSYLGSSEEINFLLARVATTFINHFTNSNRREGMKLLRPKARKEKHRVTFLSGFFSGCSFALLVAVVLRIESGKLMDKEEGPLYMVNVLLFYSLFGYTILQMLLYAANIYFWRRYQVNYPFIFGFKQGTELSYQEIFLLSNGLAVLALASFLVNLHLDMDSRTQHYKKLTELFPLYLLTIVVVILFCPFNIIYRSSRFFFIKCLIHCVCAPFYKVKLPDFFLADHLTSQVQAIRIVELYICHYGFGKYSKKRHKCEIRGFYTAFYFFVAFLPFWIRFLQCLRRLFDEKDAVHAYNALKYFSIIVAILLRTAFELKKGTAWLVLSLIGSAIATIACTYWDIVMDWGLLRRKSKNPYLRDKLVVSHKSVYFAAMVLNIILRVVWMQLVLQFNLRSPHKVAIITVGSCLEIIRRGIWSFFRLENEHLNNVGKYRAFKSVPLPFSYYDEEDNNVQG